MTSTKRKPTVRKILRLYAVIWGTNVRYVPATSDDDAVRRWTRSASGPREGISIEPGVVRSRLADRDETDEWNAAHTLQRLPRPDEVV